MSESTVERISAAIGFKAKYQQPKEKLTENKKEYRVRFAKEIPKILYYLLPWCFSDECIIALEPYKRKVRVFPGIQCDEQYHEKEEYPIKIMVWGCISKDFKSNFIIIEGNLNAESYQKMLAENQIFGKLNDRFGPKGFVFQQDGARPHTAKSTKLFLEGRVTMLFDDLHWPSSSPDLNVIEICWSIIKSKINYQEIHTADDLYRAASEAWNNIPIETINLLIESFDARLSTCISLRGNSLNGYRKLVSLYKKSIDHGNNYIMKLREEKQGIATFLAHSRFFLISLKNQMNNNVHPKI